jgi:hypothetical protein
LLARASAIAAFVVRRKDSFQLGRVSCDTGLRSVFKKTKSDEKQEKSNGPAKSEKPEEKSEKPKDKAEKPKEKPPNKEKKKVPTDQGIANFFQKVDRTTPEAAKVRDENDEAPAPTIEEPIPCPVIRKPKAPKIPKLMPVYPPQFHPVRATTDDAGFMNRMKVREFVLKCTPLARSLLSSS